MKIDLPKLNLPEYEHKIAEKKGIISIYDEFRHKYVALTPEEWVRQNFIKYLVNDLGYPKGRINLEMSLTNGKKSKRCDALVFDTMLNAILIVECKATHVKIDQKVFNQIGMYNISLKVENLIVTNGLVHYYCKIDFNDNKFTFFDQIPQYNSLL